MLGGALRTLGLGPTPGGGGSPGGKTPGGPDGGLIILGGGTPTIFHTNISKDLSNSFKSHALN